MTYTWEFSVTNGLFTLSLFAVLAGIHWLKMHRLRLTLHADLTALQAQLAPAAAAMTNVGSSFLADKLMELEGQVDEVAVRLQHVETMLETAQNGAPG